MKTNFSFDTVLDFGDLLKEAVQDRNRLLEAVCEIYPRFSGRSPAELVADVIFDVCHWAIVHNDLGFHQRAYCDFSSRRVFVNSNLSKIAKRLKVDLTALKRTTLGHELGHIRLHQAEMEQRDFRSHLGPGMGYDDSRSYQRENEAELYAAVFLVPREQLLESGLVRDLQEYQRNPTAFNAADVKDLTKELKAINQALSTLFGVTPCLMSRALEAYRFVDRKSSNRGDSFQLSLPKFREGWD